MNERMAMLLLTVQIRDGMTATMLTIAAILLLCGWLLQKSPYPKRMKALMLNSYAGFVLATWVLWLIVLASIKGLQ